MKQKLNWNEWYQLAVEYANEHNGSIESIEVNYITKNNYRLGNWISRQRIAYKNRNIKTEKKSNNNALTDKQVAKLESIGMVWSSWDKWYKLAVEYANEHNGSIADMKETYVTINGDELGIWVKNQREAYKNRNTKKEQRTNRRGVLTDEQVTKLESIGMVWNAKPDYNASWNEWYQLAVEYANEHDGSIASMKETYVTKNNDKVGKWVRNQKTAYRNRFIPKEKRTYTGAPLTDEKIVKLEKIGIIWNQSENEEKIEHICTVYDINFNKNKKILKIIPVSFLQAKINYCLNNDIPLTINNELHEIFLMSSANLYLNYGITQEDLFNEYQLKMKVG